MSTSADNQMRDLLDAITARLQRGEAIDPPAARSDDAQDELEEFVEVVGALHACLKPLSPNQEFAEDLRAELLDGRAGFFRRLRRMPARLSLAAILALFAGCVLLLLRRVFGSETAHDVPEEAVATPL